MNDNNYTFSSLKVNLPKIGVFSNFSKHKYFSAYLIEI